MARSDLPESNRATHNERAGFSGPKLWLHLEGLAVLVAAVLLYAQTEWSWWLFAALILAPDLAMLGYLVNSHVGSLLYNALHNYVLALALLGLGTLGSVPLLYAIGLILLAHIGMDRLVGYGLKYGDRFQHTHLDEV